MDKEVSSSPQSRASLTALFQGIRMTLLCNDGPTYHPQQHSADASSSVQRFVDQIWRNALANGSGRHLTHVRGSSSASPAKSKQNPTTASDGSNSYEAADDGAHRNLAEGCHDMQVTREMFGGCGAKTGGGCGSPFRFAARTLSSQIMGILCKITPSNYEVLSGELHALPLRQSFETSNQTLEDVVTMLHNKATRPDDSPYVELYVRLVASIYLSLDPCGIGESFRAALIQKCYVMYSAGNPDASRQNEDEEDAERSFAMKKKCRANIAFLGHLFVQKLVSARVVLRVLDELLINGPSTASSVGSTSATPSAKSYKPTSFDIELFAALFAVAAPYFSSEVKNGETLERLLITSKKLAYCSGELIRSRLRCVLQFRSYDDDEQSEGDFSSSDRRPSGPQHRNATAPEQKELRSLCVRQLDDAMTCQAQQAPGSRSVAEDGSAVNNNNNNERSCCGKDDELAAVCSPSVLAPESATSTGAADAALLRTPSPPATARHKIACWQSPLKCDATPAPPEPIDDCRNPQQQQQQQQFRLPGVGTGRKMNPYAASWSPALSSEAPSDTPTLSSAYVRTPVRTPQHVSRHHSPLPQSLDLTPPPPPYRVAAPRHFHSIYPSAAGQATDDNYHVEVQMNGRPFLPPPPPEFYCTLDREEERPGGNSTIIVTTSADYLHGFASAASSSSSLITAMAPDFGESDEHAADQAFLMPRPLERQHIVVPNGTIHATLASTTSMDFIEYRDTMPFPNCQFDANDVDVWLFVGQLPSWATQELLHWTCSNEVMLPSFPFLSELHEYHNQTQSLEIMNSSEPAINSFDFNSCAYHSRFGYQSIACTEFGRGIQHICPLTKAGNGVEQFACCARMKIRCPAAARRLMVFLHKKILYDVTGVWVARTAESTYILNQYTAWLKNQRGASGGRGRTSSIFDAARGVSIPKGMPHDTMVVELPKMRR